MSAIEILAMILCSALGFFIGYRAAMKALVQRWLSALELTRIGSLGVFLTMLATQFFPMKSASVSFRIFLLIHLPLLLSGFLAWITMASRRRAQISRIDEIVTSLSIQMRKGLSLRSALELMSEEVAPMMRSTVQELARNVAFSPQNKNNFDNSDGFIDHKSTSVSSGLAIGVEFETLIRELRWIERESTTPLQSVVQLREKIRTTNMIRRRSRQASAQARAQSSIMGFIYFLLAIASSLFFGWKASYPWILNSFAPFAIGSIWIWRGAKRIRWTL